MSILLKHIFKNNLLWSSQLNIFIQNKCDKIVDYKTTSTDPAKLGLKNVPIPAVSELKARATVEINKFLNFSFKYLS